MPVFAPDLSAAGLDSLKDANGLAFASISQAQRKPIPSVDLEVFVLSCGEWIGFVNLLTFSQLSIQQQKLNWSRLGATGKAFLIRSGGVDMMPGFLIS